MEAYERPETVGEAVTPQEEAIAPDEGETGTDLAERSAGEGHSHEENHRYQAARRQGAPAMRENKEVKPSASTSRITSA